MNDDHASLIAVPMLVVLATTNPVYKLTVLAAALTALVAGAGLRRAMRPLLAASLVAAFAIVLNFVSAHLGDTVLFSLPTWVPAVGGPYTLEALVYGAVGGVTIGGRETLTSAGSIPDEAWLLTRDAFAALAPGAPFVQFTYSVAPPIPKSLPGVSTEASERIWMNLPPARVWVYRKD